MKEEYTTKNLNLASFLYASGIHFVGANKINGEFFFRFTPKDKAAEFVENYFSDTAIVNPRELHARLRDLKDLMFQSGNVKSSRT